MGTNQLTFWKIIPYIFYLAFKHMYKQLRPNSILWNSVCTQTIELCDFQAVTLFKLENILQPKAPTKLYLNVFLKNTKNNKIGWKKWGRHTSTKRKALTKLDNVWKAPTTNTTEERQNWITLWKLFFKNDLFTMFIG